MKTVLELIAYGLVMFYAGLFLRSTLDKWHFESRAEDLLDTCTLKVIGYHVTTSKKLEQYWQSGCILAPVRFWPNLETAERWSERTGRDVIIKIECDGSYPMPDHRPARWTPEIIRKWEVVR